MDSFPSARALAIARGLVRTGRASDIEAQTGYLRVVGVRDHFYWITFDGVRVLRGGRRDFADELQPGFVDAMARAGAEA